MLKAKYNEAACMPAVCTALKGDRVQNGRNVGAQQLIFALSAVASVSRSRSMTQMSQETYGQNAVKQQRNDCT